MKKTLIQYIWDFIGIPFRFVLFDQAWLPKFGWTTLEEERLNYVLPYIKGDLLDIGAGPNTLVNDYYGSGKGVDVFDWGGGVIVLPDTSNLPFEDNAFDTITFIACLNHIPNREDVIQEAYRVLKSDGEIIVTMIGPFLGELGHKIWWYGEDHERGGMVDGEVGGMSNRWIVDLFDKHGFQLVVQKRITLGLNNFFVFKKRDEKYGEL
jgi:SAM-dependent methyltransferase